MNLSPTDWHTYQGTGSKCELCGCPASPLVLYKRGRLPSARQQHRAVDGPAKWERRATSPAGWRVSPIRRPQADFRQRIERRIAEDVRAGIIKATAMLAVGRKPRGICKALGIKSVRLANWQKRHREFWQECLGQAKTVVQTVRDLPELGRQLLSESAHHAVPNRPPAPCVAPSVSRLALRYQENYKGPLGGTEGTGLTLAEFFVQTYQPLRLLGRKAATVEQYVVTIRQFARFAGRPVHLGDLTDDLLAGFMRWIVDIGDSVATANKHRRNAQSLWRLAYRRRDAAGQRLVPDLPEVDRLPEPKRKVRAWTPQEFAKIIEAAERTPGEYSGVSAGPWWRALLLVLYYAGVRIDAALGIEAEHVEFIEGWAYLYVPAEHQKHRSDQRFKLPPDAVEALRACIRPMGRVFPWPYSRGALFHVYRRIVKRAGFTCGRKDLFHKVRRLSATQVAAKLGRAAAMDHLGHSVMSVTERYLDLSQIPTVQAADVLPRVTGNGRGEAQPSNVQGPLVVAQAIERLPQPETFRQSTPAQGAQAVNNYSI